MNSRKTSRSLLWPGAFAGLVALLSMMVQVVFYADHIGASAARSAGLADPDARLGILEICTGEGVQLITLDGQPVQGHTDCPICENASVLAFGEPEPLAEPVFPFVAVATVLELPQAEAPAEARFPGAKPIRAPPFAWA
jgi:hypothetical protein